MTIRSRLLSLLLPALAILIGLIAFYLYFNWSHEIIKSFKSRLQSIVIATAPSIDPEEIKWINEHIHDEDLINNARYIQDRQKLVQLKEELPINNLYVVNIEPINKEDYSLLSNKNSDLTHKQVYLIDASHKENDQVNAPGDIDFSESEEHKIYFTKKPLVTPIYESRKTGEGFMSAYAPIQNKNGDVVALVGADMSTTEIDRKLHNAILAIFTSTLFTLLMVATTVYLIANRISKPVQQLNKAALDIAAGNYDANIQVEGPKEIVELANTFNTMSECLVENISRLKEGSLIRERIYGEYECGLLLQNYMLQKVVDDVKNPHLKMKLTSINFSNVQKGILLKSEVQANQDFHLTWIEATDEGFEAIYNLNKAYGLSIDELKNYPYIDCLFEKNYSLLHYRTHGLFSPLVWSLKNEAFANEKNGIVLAHQDMIFLYNSGLIEQFQTEENIKKWFSKILRHFADDGLETIHTMLSNELTFLAKRENLKGNFQILSIQVNLSEPS